MKLLNMNEWADVCKAHNPMMVMEKPSATPYWRSSNSEHYWKLIPASWGFNENGEKQNGHKMMETTLFEEISRK